MKKILITIGYWVCFGFLYYWLVVPTIEVYGHALPELIESFVRQNIPQFFIAIFLTVLPLVGLIISGLENDNNHQ